MISTCQQLMELLIIVVSKKPEGKQWKQRIFTETERAREKTNLKINSSSNRHIIIAHNNFTL